LIPQITLKSFSTLRAIDIDTQSFTASVLFFSPSSLLRFRRYYPLRVSWQKSAIWAHALHWGTIFSSIFLI
jgi:hypothetical protein